jgi:spore coat protein H
MVEVVMRGILASWFILLAPIFALAAPSTRPASIDPFSPDKVHIVHLHLTPAAWKTMQPAKLSIWNQIWGSKPVTRPATQPYKEGDRLKPSPMGNLYAYVKTDVEFDGQKWPGAGVRFKGNSSYWAGSSGLHRPMKIDFRRFDSASPAKIRGFENVTELNLHNNAFDPTQMREIFSYMLLRDAGLPAPRVSLAVLYLTIDGKYDHQYVGLYTLVEEVDKRFLKREFGDGKGLLMKPENLFGGIQYMGEDWSRYLDEYRPKGAATAPQSNRTIEFARLVSKADDVTFRRDIGAVLDIDNFLKFLAMNALLGNLDSYLSFGHNFYLYLNPLTNQFEFISWDLNLSFGAFGWVGAPEDQMRLSIMKPHVPANRLIERVFAIDEYAARYKDFCRQYAERVIDEKKIARQVDHLESLMQMAHNLEIASRSSGTRSKERISSWGTPPAIKAFLAARVQSIHDQLAGKDEGYQPKFKLMGIFGKAQPDQHPPRPGQ